MIEKIRHDLNAISEHYVLAQGCIDTYADTVCDAVEEYLAQLPVRIIYTTEYNYDCYENIGFFTVAVYDTERVGGDMHIFTYKYIGGGHVYL